MYFNEVWLQKNIFMNPEWSNSRAAEFLKSSHKLVSWPEVSGSEPEKTFGFNEMLTKRKSDFTANQLKTYSHNLINHFFLALNNAESCYYYDLNNDDRDLIFKIEKYLLENLTSDFAGIDALSKRFYISPTKLKANFKIMYGTSLYQYFREKQMQLAIQLIKTGKFNIKEVALKLGYENASKFSHVFKECVGKLPSEI
ncbi:MAG: helix-turn-helix transcriptional regulator [Sphingobacteriaceae bacterium]|nr:helix-turn-helix transcriptional regulator [Sphingobacteriaceae bacterium]